MAECETASTPGVTDYAKATGVGVATRVITPMIGAGVGAVAAMQEIETSEPRPELRDTKLNVAAMAVWGALGTAVGFVAGPVVGTYSASKTLNDEQQRRFEDCLLARGYEPLPSATPPRVLVLAERQRTTATAIAAFKTELERRGYRLGRTLQVEVQWWDRPRFTDVPAFARPWDVVVAPSAEGAEVALQAMPKTAIVLAESEADPVKSRLASSYATPKRRVSGLTFAPVLLHQAHLRLLLQAAPHLRTIGAVLNPGNPEHRVAFDELLDAAGTTVHLRRIEVNADTRLAELFQSLRGEVDGLIVLGDPSSRWRRDEIAALAKRERLPAIAGDVGFADADGLLEYHPAIDASWQEAAGFVDKIVRGAAVGSLPIWTVVGRDFVVNAATAEALGLELPDQVLSQATRIVR